MSYKDDKRKKRDRKGPRHIDAAFFAPEAHDITHEKQKARNLRNTAWWNRKKSRGLCYYCGKRVPPDQLTMDHLIPLARGGKSERHNLVPACKECNNKKKYLLPTEWDEYLESIKNAGKEII